MRFPLAFIAATSTGAVAFAVACGDSGPSTDTMPPPSATPTTTASAHADSGPSTVPTSNPDSGDGAPVKQPTTPVRFVALGDTGHGCSNSADPQCAVADAIAAKCTIDGCDFGLLLGDNIYPSGAASADDGAFQTVFEEPYKKLDFPFYVALGNHDYGNDGAGTDFPKGQNEVDYTQKSKKWKLPANHYRQTFGNGALELFVTDTNMAMFNEEQPQRSDFKSWMASSTATWKIATGHHPYLSNGPHGNAGCYDGYVVPGVGCVSVPPADGAGVKSFLEDAVCGRVDLYLCGHDHSRQWLTDTCKGTELAVSGGGSATTELKGSDPTRFQKATPGFLYVKIDGQTLNAEFIDSTGNVEFSRTLTKP